VSALASLSTSPRTPTLVGTSVATTMRTLTKIVASAEPAVVFTSLVRLCVPTICDAASVTICEDGGPTYGLSWPHDFEAAESDEDCVLTSISGRASEFHSAYIGVLALSYSRRHVVGDSVVARLLVKRAVATIAQERFSDLRPFARR
jgi:hypothetical protein